MKSILTALLALLFLTVPGEHLYRGDTTVSAKDRNVGPGAAPAPATQLLSGIGILQVQKPQSDFIYRTPPPVSAEAKREMEAKLNEARIRYEANPHDPDAIIWLGRRLGYLGRFREALQIFSDGVFEFPADPRFYRHRGHRYITLRRFDLAIQDLEKAATLIKGKADEVEPDGQPNARNIPTSTLQFNIWYHLGLAHYLKGNNEKALRSYRECLKVSKNPDALVATAHWLYLTLRRLNRLSEEIKLLAMIKEKMDVIENHGYHQLLMMYKGQISAESLEQAASKQEASPGSYSILYGVGYWHRLDAREKDALRVFSKILAGNQWTSFGYIAAEAEMGLLKKPIQSQRTK